MARFWGYEGVPELRILSERNGNFIDVKPLTMVKLFKWEDESWSNITLTANYLKNDNSEAIPYFLVPSNKGKFSVYIECEGFQAVKSIGGAADGCWCGLVAYNKRKDGWQAREYSGVKITNYRASAQLVGGHPDAELNDCKFKPERCVESDFSCSFHLESEEDGYWALQAPPVQKSNDYNYVVSYGNYTEKVLEWGSISISIDEMNNETASSRVQRGGPRKLVAIPPPMGLSEMASSTIPPRGAMGLRMGNQEIGQAGTQSIEQLVDEWDNLWEVQESPHRNK